MSLLPIKDSRIKVIPSKTLETFVKTHLSRELNLPEAIKSLCIENIANEERKSTINCSSNTPVDFTETQKVFLRKVNNENIAETDFDAVCALNFEKDGTTTKLPCYGLPALLLNDLKWIKEALDRLRKTKDIPYLHEFMQECTLVLPENDQLLRNAVLEARCQKLRKEQEAREYEAMTRNVDNVRTHMPQDTIASQMKQINRQLIAVAQFIFSVAAGFAFGFIGIELIVGQLDFGFRLLLGIIIALIVALAEIYFLAKKLNEDYEIPKNLHPSLVPDNKQPKVIETIHVTNMTSKSSKASKPHND